ncbi:MAG: translocation/assembly module TamB domain-containing protein, partial [Bacteroidales bacterium]|nr:translocation/assembly module TamB domain-containing protein [Bacteroidales bacterium]
MDYRADGPFSVSEKGLDFNDILLSDKYGHHATLSGGIPYDHFKDLRTNIRIDLQDIMALNTTSKHNETFYGRAFANGTLRVTGPLERLRLNMNLTPTGNSSIHIPLGSSAKQTQSLLTFINNENGQRLGMYDSLMLAKRNRNADTKKVENDISVNLRLNATPDAEIQLEIDKDTGDILKARGNGQIGITVDGSGFAIKGDYRVDSGSYHFGMLGFTSRDFSIDPGGTIAFTDDVMESDLDLTATYRTKASISPLIADSTAVSSRRTVECGIGVTGKLSNP